VVAVSEGDDDLIGDGDSETETDTGTPLVSTDNETAGLIGGAVAALTGAVVEDEAADDEAADDDF